MKELNNNPEVVGCESSESTPFSRLVDEKRALDEKIVKLTAFLADDEKACNIAGYQQVSQMREQHDVMVRYSNILNSRILTWRNN